MCLCPILYRGNFYNKQAAIITASLVASSSILIEYSTNARGYTLVCLFFLIMISILSYLRYNHNLAAWILFALFGSIGFYTIPIMLYPFIIFNIWFVINCLYDIRQNSIALSNLIKFSILSCLLAFIFYIPVVIVTGIESIVGNPFVTTRTMSYVVANLPSHLLAVLHDWMRDYPSIIVCFMTIGMIVFIIYNKQFNNNVLSLFIAVILCCLIVFFLQKVIPFERVWLFLLPLFLSFSGIGLSFMVHKSAKGKNVATILLSIVILMLTGYNIISHGSIYKSSQTGTFIDAKEIALFFKTKLNDNERVIAICPSNAILSYYFNYYNIAYNYLYYDNLNASSIYIVVNNTEGQNIDTLINYAGKVDRKNIILIKRYSSGSIYWSDTLD